jgi:phospholipase/lecithinase/hemolysin
LLAIGMFALLSCVPVFARLHHYNKIVVFGDSLSDTGNDTFLSSESCSYPVPAPYPFDYTYGSFTDGYDTLPPAESYSGVWIQQLAADLAKKPPVIASLDGGTNYAYGDAYTGNGYTKVTIPQPDNTTCSIAVANIGQQISDYLQTHPDIDNDTLFVVWGGANNVLTALLANNVTTTTNQILNAAQYETTEIQTLIQAGAKQILIPNLPPLGLIPRLNGSSTTKLAGNAAAELYNTQLARGISLLQNTDRQRHIRIYQLDVYHLLQQVVAVPSQYSLTNVTSPSQGQPVDPDTYLFWDDLHPTTRGHNILANDALQLLSKDPEGNQHRR